MIVELRWYQQEAVDAIRHYLRTQDGNPCVELPTGSGKSLVIAELIRCWPTMRVLVLAHRKELVEQNYFELHELEPSICKGIYSAGLGRKDTSNRVTFASIDSLVNKPMSILAPHVIIIDEAHMLSPKDGTKYQKLIAHYKARNPKLRVVGLTATPYRMDSGNICHKDFILTDLVYSAPIGKLIDQGYLCKLRSKIQQSPDVSGVRKNGRGDFVNKSLAEAVDVPRVVQSAVADAVAIINRENRQGIMFFCVSEEHCQHVAKCLEAHGIIAPVVTAKTKSRDRDRIVDDFKAKRLRAITNIDVYTTGFNAKHVDCIVMLRPTLSKGLYCIDEQTEILTENGFSKDVKEGDYIPCFNAKDGSISPSKVVATARRPVYKGEKWVSMKGPSTDVRVTGDHNMLYRTSRHRPWWLKKALDVAGMTSGVHLPVSGVREFKGVPLSDYDLQFIAWVMTDGSINKKNGAVMITQASHQPWIRKIDECIQGCGFKYRKAIRNSKSQFTRNSDCIAYTISKGKPRGSDKHLTGWGRLEPWLSKDMSDLLLDMTERQFDVFIEAFHYGDGAKQAGQDFTPRSFHISCHRRHVAEKIQLCAIQRGWRCSLAFQKNNYSGVWIIHLKKQDFVSVGSTYDTRPKWEVSESDPDETCWCVQTETGTIITRRNGKVAIMGNCQIVGRGLRIHPSKQSCLVLDYGGNIERHGPIDCLEGDRVRIHKCGGCGDIFAFPLGKCPHCGTEIPKAKREAVEAEDRERKLNEEARAYAEIIGAMPTEHKVDGVQVFRHVKPGGVDSMRVEYRCGLNVFREWICLDHEGLPGRKAYEWWMERFGPPPPKLDDALGDLFGKINIESVLTSITESITTKKNGKFNEIICHNLKQRKPLP